MNIGIVGAGVIGSLTALLLKRSGFKVSLWTASSPGSGESCSHAAGGMLSPIAEAIYGNQQIAEAGWDSVERWADILVTLENKVMFGQEGSLICAAPNCHGEISEWTQRLTHKFPKGPWELLSSGRVRSWGDDFEGWGENVIHLKNEGFIDTRAVLSGLAQALEREDVPILYGHRVDRVDEGTIYLGGESFCYDMVIDCRGFGAKKDIRNLRGVRGEALLVYAPELSLKHPVRMLDSRYPVYIVPRENSQYYVGATVVESDHGHPISVQSLLEILTGLCKFHHGFRYAQVLESIVQVRPALDDHLPMILSLPRLIRVNGFFRHGFLLGPIVAKSLVNIVNARPLEPRIHSWVTTLAVSET